MGWLISDILHASFMSDAEITMLGEFEFIEKLKVRAPKGGRRRLTQSIGDDCAIFRNRKGNEIVITTDLLIEEIDFQIAYTTATDLGHKAFTVSASDIAAMGARSLFSLISIGVPQSAWESGFGEGFYHGFNAQAERFGVVNIGGDISRTPKQIVIDSIMIGEVKRGHAIRRSGALPGDLIFVSGQLGGAAAGLAILNDQLDRLKRAEHTPVTARCEQDEARQKLIARHIRPHPQLALGLLLGQKKLASAMIDISDGLSSDLLHLCNESGVGANINANSIPVDQNIYKSGLTSSTPLNYALNGGEDFELLFTVKPRNVRHLYRELHSLPIFHIGVVTPEKGELLIVKDGKAEPLIAGGHRHF